MNLEEMTKKELIAEVEKAEAEIAEAEKEIYARSEGEEKEWERAEKAEAELVEYKTINPKEYDWVAENQRLQERVRELEDELKGLLDNIQSTTPEIAGYSLLHVVRHDEKNIKRLRRLLEAQAQTKEGE